MAQDDAPKPASDQPTWKDLAEFTSKQAENDRKVIDLWFKRATTLLGIVLVIAATVIGFIGWKTIADAKAAAETAAQSRVSEVLKDERIQNLARETAQKLFSEGAFRQATEEQVRQQLPSAVTAEMTKLLPVQIAQEFERRGLVYRTVPPALARALADRLSRFKGTSVTIRTALLPERLAFASSIQQTLRAAGLSTSIQSQDNYTFTGASEPDIVNAKNEELAHALTELISRSDGTKPDEYYGKSSGLEPNQADINIGSGRQPARK